MARIITSEKEVPAGWVRIAEMVDNATDAKILSEAHTAELIPAVKLLRHTKEYRTGPVWVDPVPAEELLQQHRSRRVASATPKPASKPLPSSDPLVDAMNRLASALEAIAVDRGGQ